MRMTDLIPIDFEHEVRAQFSNPIGTPKRHRILKHRFKFSKKASHHLRGKEQRNTMPNKNKAAVAEKTTLGTKEVAAKLGVEAKLLRAVLRAANKGSDGQRYEWKQDDSLAKEKKMIEDYKKRQEERAASAKDEPASKKKAAKKKAPKKAKAKKEEEEEETEEPEEI